MAATSRSDYDTDVAIVGYGPSGVSAANFLGAAGVRVVAVERDSGIYPRARAVTISDWTLRCYQSVGLDQELLRNMDTTEAIRWRTYAGKEIARFKAARSVLNQPVSSNIYQPVMEQSLRDGAARYADHVAVRFGVEATGVEQDDESATVVTLSLGTGTPGRIRARYVLACDGGASPIRSNLGIRLEGETIDTKWVVIDARVKRWWPDRHILTMWSDAKRPVVDIPLALGHHRWEFPLEPHESETDFSTQAQLWPLLNAMGVTPDDIEINQHAFYKHHVRHAQRWRDRRVFLLGDAAHLMPPWAGQGMQSGVRDAHNLSWKLREVLAGRLPDALLDSYEIERAPNVAHITRLSAQLGRMIKMQTSRREKAMALVGQMLGKLGVKPPRPSVIPALTAGWLHGAVGPASAVGRLIPQPRVATPAGRMVLLDDFLGNGFVLLGDAVDPATLLGPDQKSRWDALGTRSITIRPPSQITHAASDLVDIEGTLSAWMRKYGAQAIAVRPDKFVAAAHGDRAAGLHVPS